MVVENLMYESSRVTEEEMAQFRSEWAKAVEILKASGYDLNKIKIVCKDGVIKDANWVD